MYGRAWKDAWKDACKDAWKDAWDALTCMNAFMHVRSVHRMGIHCKKRSQIRE